MLQERNHAESFMSYQNRRGGRVRSTRCVQHDYVHTRACFVPVDAKELQSVRVRLGALPVCPLVRSHG